MDLRIAGASPRFDREGATVRQYSGNLAVIMSFAVHIWPTSYKLLRYSTAQSDSSICRTLPATLLPRKTSLSTTKTGFQTDTVMFRPPLSTSTELMIHDSTTQPNFATCRQQVQLCKHLAGKMAAWNLNRLGKHCKLQMWTWTAGMDSFVSFIQQLRYSDKRLHILP